MNHSRLADKYISLDGGPPTKASLTPSEEMDAIVTVSAFLVFCPPEEMWGSRRASEALSAFASLIGVPVSVLITRLKGSDWDD